MAIKTLQSLSVPDETDDLFTSPDYTNWFSLLSENKESLFDIKNRQVAQSEVLKIANGYTQRIGMKTSNHNMSSGVIVTGHQANWHHAGILAKNIITDKFARQLNGTAIQLVLDHDICDTSMKFPGENSQGKLRFKTVPLESELYNMPLEFRPTLSKVQIAEFAGAVSITQDSLCGNVWSRGDFNIQSCKNIADVITKQQARLYQSLGLEINYIPVSLLAESGSFIHYLYSIICEAVNFWTCYNQAILERRHRYLLNAKQTPRLLGQKEGFFELPFWLVSQGGTRRSLFIKINNDTFQIGIEGNVLGTVDLLRDQKQQFLEILEEAHYVIRPKAVTLTLYVRLFLADWFIHGTGAANYEYITDHLIRNYYGISGINYGIASATMMLLKDPVRQNYQTTLYSRRKDRVSQKVINYREFFFGLFPRHRLEVLANVH